VWYFCAFIFSAILPPFSRLARTQHFRRILLLVVFVLGLSLLGSSPAFQGGLAHLLAAVQADVSENPLRGGLLFVLAAALAAMLAFVSSSVLVPIAIYAWGQETAFILLWLGWLLGGMASYSVGRYLGRPILRLMTSNWQVTHYERRISATAPLALVFLFQFTLPSEIPGYVLGLLKYSFGRYLLALGLAELPYALAMTFLGDALIQGNMIRFALVALGVVALLAFALYALDRQLKDPAQNGPT
jgi:uncharacterized membrane protein YdjX (TVP38/TMEM64 family)